MSPIAINPALERLCVDSNEDASDNATIKALNVRGCSCPILVKIAHGNCQKLASFERLDGKSGASERDGANESVFADWNDLQQTRLFSSSLAQLQGTTKMVLQTRPILGPPIR